MKVFLLCFLICAAICQGQEPIPLVTGPFHLNLRVVYSGAKAHPDLAAFIYKSLRDLPGVGIVDRDPDATLVIGENVHGNQYACIFTVIVPATPSVRSTLDLALSMYDEEQTAKQAIARTLARKAKSDLSGAKTWKTASTDCSPCITLRRLDQHERVAESRATTGGENP